MISKTRYEFPLEREPGRVRKLQREFILFITNLAYTAVSKMKFKEAYMPKEVTRYCDDHQKKRSRGFATLMTMI